MNTCVSVSVCLFQQIIKRKQNQPDLALNTHIETQGALIVERRIKEFYSEYQDEKV